MKAKQLITEVHERSIWQLLAISVGGSFTLLGNVELLTGRFGFPDWLFLGSLVLLAAGIIGVFGVKLWPTISRPSPAAKRSAKVGLIYIAVGWLGLEAVGTMIESYRAIPGSLFGISLFAYIILLPVAMLVSYLRYTPPGTSDEWVYKRLKPGWAGDWVFDRLVEQGLTVDAALAKMRAAADRIEQNTGKRPSGPSTKRVQRSRDAEQKADDG